jgi:hypothetical protein
VITGYWAIDAVEAQVTVADYGDWLLGRGGLESSGVPKFKWLSPQSLRDKQGGPASIS